LGLYTALVLEALEARVGAPLARRFDLLAGTSIGSLLALALALLSVQQQHVQAMMEDRLGERDLRLDADWPPQAGLGIDIATPQAVQSLRALAQHTLAEVDEQRLAVFV
jgi:predicted acylesterase/phospholipase RssA